MSKLKTKNTTIDGIAIQIVSLPLRTVLQLDRKIVGLMGPVIGAFSGIDESNFKMEDMGTLAMKLSIQMNSMSDDEYMPLMDTLLGSVTATVPGFAPVRLEGEDLDVLIGHGTLIVYKIMLEVIKFNKFLPFAMKGLLGTTGEGTQQTDTSKEEN